jgi:hypothetical protein
MEPGPSSEGGVGVGGEPAGGLLPGGGDLVPSGGGAKGPVKLTRRTSVIYNQLEGLLKTITSADAVNPLPVRDRYIRMRKYKQCFLG